MENSDKSILFSIMTITVAISVYIYIKRDENDKNQDMLIVLPILSMFLCIYLIYTTIDNSGTSISVYEADDIVEKFLSGPAEA